MSFTNHTPNYNLPQYVGTDKPTFLGDFNNAMTTIDTQMHKNAQNAGEGIAALQQAQSALTETQETLTEVQTEVANVSGIAANVNTNVQQALSAANDATTAANNATSQIQPAVAAANKASADAQAAQQVANGNVATLNNLSDRVTALEEEGIGGTAISLQSEDSANIRTISLANYTEHKMLVIFLSRYTEFTSVTPVNCTIAMNVMSDQYTGGNGTVTMYSMAVKDVTAESKINLSYSGANGFYQTIIGID